MIEIMSHLGGRFYSPRMNTLRMLRLLAASSLVIVSSLAHAQSVQEHVHGHGNQVMPFDLAKTVHVFRMTEDGGTEKVLARGGSPDPEQVRMIRHHLAMEATEFRKGNFGDPARLHSAAMRGLREMQEGAPHMQITYEELPNGAAIRFRTSDIRLVTAVHRWFGAQLSEHGADAQPE